MQKHLLCKQFVTCSCEGCRTAPRTDYIHNPVYQELIGEVDYFGNRSNERVYLDLRASVGYANKVEQQERNDSKIILYITLKSTATKKFRLRTWSYALGEYLYLQLKISTTTIYMKMLLVFFL